jgi:hypothetical protein
MRVPAAFAAAGLIVITASATACSGGSAPAGTAGSSGPETTQGTGAAAGSGSAAKLDVCTALTAAAASQITGTTFTKTKSSSVAGVVYSCEYDGPNAALLQISVSTQGGPVEFATDVSALKTVGHPPVSVAGVGDKAFSEPDPKGNAGSAGASSFASFGALFGPAYIHVGGLTYVTASQGKQIAEELHSRM